MQRATMAKIQESNCISKKNEEDIVDPWNVVGTLDTGIDYNKLIGKSTYIEY